MKFIFIIISFILYIHLWCSLSYTFWVFSDEDNRVNNIVSFEKQYWVKTDIVWFIFDTFKEKDLTFLKKQIKLLWKNRIYHISISPYWYTAKQVANWAYDTEYLRFFKFVKKSWIKVLFRTAHEMNWSWYSRSWDPIDYKKMWKRIYHLSRKVGLNKSNILFIFSVNSIDLPSKNWKMIVCNPWYKKISNCLSFENYYPWSKYVNLMWMTLYNWWRGRPWQWAHWRSFWNLLNDSRTRMFSRLKKYWKKIIIDELWTTAVDFKWKRNIKKVRYAYNNNYRLKNKWIKNINAVLQKNPEIIAIMYFNRDKTHWFTKKVSWELDWSAFNYKTNKFYLSILNLYKNSNVSSLPFKKRKKNIIEKYKNIIKNFLEKINYKNADKIYHKINYIKNIYHNEPEIFLILNYIQKTIYYNYKKNILSVYSR